MELKIEIFSESDDESIFITAICEKLRAGRLNGRRYGPSLMYLEDIQVEDTAPIKRSWLDYLLRRTRCRNYRKRGIGSQLLSEFLHICQQRRICEVVGSIVQPDLDANANLLDWYSKHGFAVRPLHENPSPPWFRPPNTNCEIICSLQYENI